MEYDFEDLSIIVDGAKVGRFDGTAYLEPDRAGYRVASICLDGPEMTWLFRNGGSPLEHALRTAIDAAIYASDHARDAWREHCEEEAADAA